LYFFAFKISIALWRAQLSISTAAGRLSGRFCCGFGAAAIVARTSLAISVNNIRPSKNAFTATSSAAFSTAGIAPPSLIGPRDLFQADDVMTAPPRGSDREAAIPPPQPRPEREAPSVPERPGREAALPPPDEAAIPPPEPERNPSNHSDALWIQTRLHDLGYFTGNGTGIWGPASRYALRDFKTMNGLAEDEKWDRDTEHRLASKQTVPAASTFIGGWAQSAEECQQFHGTGAPLVIRSRGADTQNVKCSFRSLKREPPASWRVQATCTAGGQSWNANVSLKLTGSSLNWSSENGNETYVRCSVKP